CLSLSLRLSPRSRPPLHTLPTRRSSDLSTSTPTPTSTPAPTSTPTPTSTVDVTPTTTPPAPTPTSTWTIAYHHDYEKNAFQYVRSEEHTSELQSREKLV